MDLALTPQQLGGLTYALPVLVAFTSWWQTKMTTPGGTGGQQPAGMNQSMTLMMPLMFGFFSLNFSTGLSFYFIVSNIIGIVTQGFISGWEGLKFWKGINLSSLLGGGAKARTAAPKQVTATSTGAAPTGSQKGTTSGSKSRKKRRRKR
jgi:YidC/Oxa1 family membrane protein insertase